MKDKVKFGQNSPYNGKFSETNKQIKQTLLTKTFYPPGRTLHFKQQINQNQQINN